MSTSATGGRDQQAPTTEIDSTVLTVAAVCRLLRVSELHQTQGRSHVRYESPFGLFYSNSCLGCSNS